MLAAAALAVGGVTLPASAAQAAPACDVVYATNDWNSGFTANVTIKNLGDPVSNWTLKCDLPEQQPAGDPGLVGQVQPDRQRGHRDQRVVQRQPRHRGVHHHRLQRLLLGQQPEADRRSRSTAPPATAPRPTSRRRSPSACRAARSPRPADVPLTATASDPDGTISKVEFYRNGLLLNTDTTAPYAYTLDGPAGRQLHRPGQGVRQRQRHRRRREVVHGRPPPPGRRSSPRRPR